MIGFPSTDRLSPTGQPERLQRAVIGSAAGTALVGVAAGAMLPLRADLSVATTALVLVVPVVVGAATGGFPAGAWCSAAGFLVYDFVFIRPYYTLAVGSAQNWTALGVYAAVTVVVARVVARLDAARSVAQTRASELRRLFDLSELLVRNSTVPALLDTIVVSVRSAFDLAGAALLLPGEGGRSLQLVASDGDPLSAAELEALSLTARPGTTGSAGALQTLALTTSTGPVGLLALRGAPRGNGRHELLRAFANHLALALERAQLQDQAVRAGLLEEVDRLRRGLIGAVSHDLRTPLSTIKLASSTLLDPGVPVPAEDSRELLELVDAQADRLDRLVANLLDMTRIQAGALELRRGRSEIAALVGEAVAVVGSVPGAERIQVQLPVLPAVDVDPVLVRQVLVNLLDNALRHGPAGTAVTVSAHCEGGRVTVSVADEGPGPPPERRVGLAEAIAARAPGSGGGLGLAIVQTFVEVHGGKVWAERAGRGSRVSFTLPVAA